MARLRDLNLNLDYQTGENDLVAEFYSPCLRIATKYDRASGFFSSSVLIATGRTLIDFAKRNGKMRLVCSPRLSEEDIDAIDRGYKTREEIASKNLIDEIDQLLCMSETRPKTVVLATLISCGVLEVRIAFRPPHLRLYHEKLGIFKDVAGDIVTFRGSSNETWSAWHELGNHESFDVFRSWWDQSDRQRTERHMIYFDRLWEGKINNVETTPFPEVALERLRSVAASNLNELDLPDSSPRSKRILQPHQAGAMAAWKAAGKRGILEHATGSGKTVTALFALNEQLQNRLPALVLVPSKLLLEQWALEIAGSTPEAVVLLCGAGNNSWRAPGRIEGMSANDPKLEKRIILVTLQTASKPEFLKRIGGGDHLLVICDEVHRAGSTENANIFAIRSGPRLGLSATPTRYGDPDGTAAIMGYFEKIIQPPFTLRDAIKAGRLVPYEYYPNFIELTEDENAEWTERSKAIRKEIAIEGSDAVGPVALSPRLKLLLIQRARIAKKAERKIPFAASLLVTRFKAGESWLVYCEDLEQLSDLKLVLQRKAIPVDEYHSEMIGDPGSTLKWFRLYGGVLLSVRCLDEGVDIPSVSHALILASSQNPREFIQRRGRVLRTDPRDLSKRLAVIYDALVLPKDLESETDQASLAKSELARALEFSRDALNRSAETDLMAKALSIGLDAAAVFNVGLENDLNDKND